MAITGTKLFSTGDVLTSADVNQYLMRGVKVFADAAARDAAYGGSGEPVLEEGEVCYLEDSNALQTYGGASWANVGDRLVFVKQDTIGTGVASVTVTGAFSATYDHYRIVYAGGTISTSGQYTALTLGATVAGYYWNNVESQFGGTSGSFGGANVASWSRALVVSTSIPSYWEIDLFFPFQTRRTLFLSRGIYADAVSGGFRANGGGLLDNATSYTAFTITPSSNTLSGGTLTVYGVVD